MSINWIHGNSGLTLPETKPQKSVLQYWVEQLPFRQQGVLLLALRGPDGLPKETEAKEILRALRACVLNSGRHGVPMSIGEAFDGDSFMSMAKIYNDKIWLDLTTTFLKGIDQYNVHFLQHLLHATQICSQHPIEEIGKRWWLFYKSGVHRLHLSIETVETMRYRLRNGKRLEEDE
jgi:hypothetical protein